MRGMGWIVPFNLDLSGFASHALRTSAKRLQVMMHYIEMLPQSLQSDSENGIIFTRRLCE